MDTDTVIDLVNKITELFQQQVSEYLDSAWKITYTDYLILHNLYLLHSASDEAAVKQEDIVKLIPFDKSTVSRRLKACEQKGLVRRRINRLSEREKLVYLTTQGKELIGVAEVQVEKISSNAIAGLDAYAVKQLQTNLRAILQQLG